ncbi:MAG TPA: hypothetical protein PKY56_13375 [Candidatus Kapabacteria bacterium]|nr:hypothetical protein [Candidatus Kapabacteria bacterium]HPO63767.1 hypothetical protein [Candidatus Kapabacteria bacterium]
MAYGLRQSANSYQGVTSSQVELGKKYEISQCFINHWVNPMVDFLSNGLQALVSKVDIPYLTDMEYLFYK